MRVLFGLTLLLASTTISMAQNTSTYDDSPRSRGWMKTEKDLLIFKQHLYLRQPGYGTSYVTGKYLLEQTLADCARQVEQRGSMTRWKNDR